MGADDAVDHRGDLAGAVKKIKPDGVDVALHLAGEGAAIAALARSGGRLASTLGLAPVIVDLPSITCCTDVTVDLGPTHPVPQEFTRGRSPPRT